MTAVAERTGLRGARLPLVIGGAAAAVLALVYVADTEGGPTLCPFKAATGWDCPGCGLTRGLHDLLHGDVAAALDHNVLLALAVPAVLLGWAVWVRRAWRGEQRPLRIPVAVVWGSVALLVGFWVVRNIAGVPYLGSS